MIKTIVALFALYGSSSVTGQPVAPPNGWIPIPEPPAAVPPGPPAQVGPPPPQQPQIPQLFPVGPPAPPIQAPPVQQPGPPQMPPIPPPMPPVQQPQIPPLFPVVQPPAPLPWPPVSQQPPITVQPPPQMPPAAVPPTQLPPIQQPPQQIPPVQQPQPPAVQPPANPWQQPVVPQPQPPVVQPPWNQQPPPPAVGGPNPWQMPWGGAGGPLQTKLECKTTPPNPASCAFGTKTIINPSNNYEVLCTVKGSCYKSTINIDLTPSGWPIERLKLFKFIGEYAAANAHININNQRGGQIRIDEIKCDKVGACNNMVITLGPGIYIEQGDFYCTYGACDGCTMNGVPCYYYVEPI